MNFRSAFCKSRALVFAALIVLTTVPVLAQSNVSKLNGAINVQDSVSTPVVRASTSLRSADLVVTDSLGVARAFVGTTMTTADAVVTDSLGVARAFVGTALTTADALVTDSLGVARAFVGTDLVVTDSIGADQIVLATYAKTDSLDVTGAMTVDGDLMVVPINFCVADPDSNEIIGRFYAPYPMTVVSVDMGYTAKGAQDDSLWIYSNADAVVKRLHIASGVTFTRNSTSFALNTAADTVYFKYFEPALATESDQMNWTLWVLPLND